MPVSHGNPLDHIPRDLLVAAIVEARGARIGVTGQALNVSSGMPCSSKSVIVVTRNECGERLSGRSASRSRRFIMWQTSLTGMQRCSELVLRMAVGKKAASFGASRRPAESRPAALYGV